MRRIEDLEPWKHARLLRRAADLERHLLTAYQVLGQAHLQSKAKGSPEKIARLVDEARAALDAAEIALAKVKL